MFSKAYKAELNKGLTNLFQICKKSKIWKKWKELNTTVNAQSSEMFIGARPE